MSWNKCFKATVWTICEVNQWIYGQLLNLKAFPLRVIVLLRQVKLVSAIWASELIQIDSCDFMNTSWESVFST